MKSLPHPHKIAAAQAPAMTGAGGAVCAGEAAGPQRTCVGCRRVDGQRQLLRATADAAGRLRLDGGGRRPGRGCYVHQTSECVKAAVRGGFQRSLRRSLRLDGSDIEAALASHDLMQPESPAQPGRLKSKLDVRGHSNRDNS